MKLNIKHINKTPFIEKSLRKTILRFAKLKKPLFLSFNSTSKNEYGYYIWDYTYNCHKIYINTENCYDSLKKEQCPEEMQLYILLLVILHELRHAQQFEKMKSSFDNICYWNISSIEESHHTIWFSFGEMDARMYQNKYLLKAVEFYKNC